MMKGKKEQADRASSVGGKVYREGEIGNKEEMELMREQHGFKKKGRKEESEAL